MHSPRLTALILAVPSAAILVVSCGSRTGLLVPAPAAAPAPACTATSSPITRPACDAGSTTISGTVYDPAGKNPLYDVVVYVPAGPPDPLPTGATCDSCSDLYTGSPSVTALTDAQGHFLLTNAPSGAVVPLVLQIGKWRRQLEVSVEPCQANVLPEGSLTLPSNRTEGDIPSIAVSTGGADTLECLFRRIGVDASEYTGDPTGAGRIHIFQGSGHGRGRAAPNTAPPGPSSSKALWDSTSDLERYDMVILSCEGQETQNMNQQALFDYAASGGRVFGSHFHYAWFDTGPFGSQQLAQWSPGDNNMGNIDTVVTTTLPGGAPFPKGQAMAQWLGTVGALLPDGEVSVLEARHNADLTAANTASQSWLAADSNASPPGATQSFSFNTPLDAPLGQPLLQCGQVVYSDMHVGAASNDNPALPVPDECAEGDLSAQEKVLEFLVFNLSSCVTATGETPQAPSPCP
jgi:hypothetical protein